MGALGLGADITPGRRLGNGGGIGFDLSGETLPAGVVVRRASVATCFDADGVLVTRETDVARIDHDPATRAPRGLLIEASATNLLPHSADLASGWTSDAGGSGVPAVVTVNDAIAPDGSRSAARIVFARGDSFSRIAIAATGTVPGAAHTLSIWLKADVAGPAIALRLDGVDGGTLTLTTGWRRYTLNANVEASTASAQMLLWAVFSDAPTTSAIHAWGAQLEPGARATSLIATAGVATIREADNVTLDWGAIGVGDGPTAIRYRSDDGSDETVATVIAGGMATISTTLVRPRVTRATRL